MKPVILILISTFSFLYIHAQEGSIPLYVSKQTGEFTKYSGSASKTTDQHESGSLIIKTTGPITASTDPSDVFIGNNESKSWTGYIQPDVSQAPEPGTSSPAEVNGNSVSQFSRPAGTPAGSGETVIKIYKCGKCPVHPNEGGGDHELIKKEATHKLTFVVYSTKVTISGSDLACKGSTLKLTAQGYPDGGTYTWKSLNDGTITVNGTDANASVSCKTGYGSGNVEVTYTIEKVTYKDTQQVTFFDLGIKLSENDICDGKSIEVTLVPKPDVDKAKIKACLPDLAIKSKTATPFKGNIVNTTDITFSALDDNLKSTSKEIYWYSTQTPCNEGSQYKIWAEGSCSCENGSLKTPEEKLTVSVKFGKCVAGDAVINVKYTDLTKPVYKNPVINWKTMTISFDVPEGDYPGVTVKGYTKDGVNYMVATYTVGKFKLDHTESNINTGEESQFYPLVKFEEEFHVKQFGGATNIPELKSILSAADVITKLNAWLAANPWQIGNDPFETQLATYLANTWGRFILEVQKEVAEFNDVTSVWAQQIRCRLEQEAKDALKAKWGKIYIADMPCAYKNCKKKK